LSLSDADGTVQSHNIDWAASSKAGSRPLPGVPSQPLVMPARARPGSSDSNLRVRGDTHGVARALTARPSPRGAYMTIAATAKGSMPNASRLCRARAAGFVASCAIALVPAIASAASDARAVTGVAHPARWPALPASLPVSADTEAFAQRILRTMTLEEKVGQLIQADIASVTPDDLRTYPLGSILAGGNAAPDADVRSSPAKWLALTDAFFRASIARTSGDHPAIPIIFGIDAVHGHARIPGATVFPHNVGLGAAHDPSLVENVGRATAEEVAATGVDWTFAPTVAVVRDVRWGRSYESYSEDPGLVAAYARAMIVGLQGRVGTSDFMSAGHTLASVKHFLGDGGTRDGRDQFDNVADERTLRDVYGAPYAAALESGALIVMASYNSWQGAKLHADRSLLTGVLKQRWSFPGFVVGDWNGQEEIPGCTKYSCPDVLSAGLDMYMAPDSWKLLYVNLIAQVRSGRVAPDRLDDAVLRVLRVKAVAGLFGKAPPSERPETRDPSVIGSAAHRALAREAVRESLVLLKNNGRVLPLEPRAHVLVTGPGADDIGMQCGGWTIDWQGDHNRNDDFPGGTSIFAGIKAAVERAGGSAELSPDGAYRERPAAAIVVYGERPYAEFEGDRETLEFEPRDGPQLEILRQLKHDGIPVISVFLSGRPMWINRELNASDALIAAWLPGTEGAGIADLLFKPSDGSAARDFTGRLAFSWPATAMPVRLTATGVAGGALFVRGYGQSIGSRATLAHLAEDPKVSADRGSRQSLFSAAHVTAPWSIYVADPTAQVRLTMNSQASPERAVVATLSRPAVRVAWAGTAKGEFRIGGRAASYTALAVAGMEITARYRVDEHPTGPVGVGIRCEAPYGTRPPADGGASPIDSKLCGLRAGALLDLTSAFSDVPVGAWRTLHVPLSCLSQSGADLENVSAPFAVEASGRFQVRFTDVRLVRSPHPGPCPAAVR
jgi:beta-glucosidase